MNTLVVLNDNNEPVTTSLKVAESFGKRHKNIIQKIERLECSIEFARLNFQLSGYKDSTGRSCKMYELTRDGFSFLVNKMQGTKAAEFTEKFIGAFNAMEAELSKPIHQALPDFTNPAEAARAWAVEYEQKVALEHKVIERDETIEKLDIHLHEQLPKVQVYDNYMSSDGLKSFSDVGRDLGIGAKTFCQMLVDDKILFRQGKRLKAYLQYIKAGYFKTVTDVKDDYVYTQHKVTPEGFVWLEGKYGKEAVM